MGAFAGILLSVAVAVAPLTGLPVADPAAFTRPVLAVKVDNAPAARPQVGLDQADVVYEELVEGGLTRFVALYHATLPDRVGPVRSVRDIDAELLPPYDPVVVISGAAEGPYRHALDAGLRVVREHEWPGYSRSVALPPHNLFVHPADLVTAGAGLPAPAPVWAFDPAVPPGGMPMPGLAIGFSSVSTARWDWDAERGLWVRDGYLAAENVVITSGAPGTTEGPGLLLRDGFAYDVVWRKLGREAPFEWLATTGEVLPLAPGRSWVELMPPNGTLSW